MNDKIAVLSNLLALCDLTADEADQVIALVIDFGEDQFKLGWDCAEAYHFGGTP